MLFFSAVGLLEFDCLPDTGVPDGFVEVPP